MNRSAFLWGRRAAHDPASVEALVTPNAVPPAPTFEASLTKRIEFLTAYQDPAYADRYRRRINAVRIAETQLGSHTLTDAVMHNLFKLMAIKDEYEVARLYAEGDFLRTVGEKFEGDYQLQFHLAPPLLARPDPKTGHVRKMRFGPWVMTAFTWLARARRWRGTQWDIFGLSAERRMERQLLADYERDIDRLLPLLNAGNLADAAALATLPEKIRGFGHVKARAIDTVMPAWTNLRQKLGIA
jgi:indolepyruvate ferredoxin oxidoreductase